MSSLSEPEARDFLIIDTLAERRFLGLAASFSSRVELEAIVELIQSTVRQTGTAGFVMCKPLPESFLLALSGAKTCVVRGDLGGLLFDPASDLLARVLPLRSPNDRWREWACGSCTDETAFKERLMQRDATTLASLLEEPDHLGCLFWQEGGWLQVMTRIYPHVDELVSHLSSLDMNGGL